MLEIKLLVLLVISIMLSVIFFITAVKYDRENMVYTCCIIYAYPDTENVEYILREIRSTLTLQPSIILVDFGLETEMITIFEKMTEDMHMVHIINP